MTRIPTPGELLAVNRRLQHDHAQRLSSERAESELAVIASKLGNSGVPYGGMRHELSASLHHDRTAVDTIVRQLQRTGWKVIEDPDDDDDIGHGRPPATVLLIRFP